MTQLTGSATADGCKRATFYEHPPAMAVPRSRERTEAMACSWPLLSRVAIYGLAAAAALLLRVLLVFCLAASAASAHFHSSRSLSQAFSRLSR